MLSAFEYRIKAIKLLAPFCSGAKKFMTVNLILTFFSAVLVFAPPMFYKIFIDEVIIEMNFSLMKIVASGYLCVFFLQTLIKYALNFGKNKIMNRCDFRLKNRMLRIFFSFDFLSYSNLNTGDLKMKMDEDIAALHDFAHAQSTQYVKSIFAAILSAVLLIKIQWKLALFSLLIIPVTFYFDIRLSKIIAYTFKKGRENDKDMVHWMKSSFEGYREIRSLNLYEHENRTFKRYMDIFGAYFSYYINYWVLRTLIIPKIKDEFIMQFCLYFFGGIMIIRRDITIGTLIVFIQYFNLFSESVKTISDLDAQLLENMPKTDRVFEELHKNFRSHYSLDYAPRQADCIIEFDNVSFRYGNSRQNVIENLSLKINRGEIVALTGSSGSGKTTVLRLLTAMTFPTEGSVRYCGISTDNLNLLSLHGQIGYVMQDNLLLNTTIRENLYYGKDNASESQLISACKKACIYDLILKLEKGFDTYIGERGVRLSGGQRQRLVLARLFLREAETQVFIFDEATSALDEYNEILILDAIKNIGRDKTILIAAHRQSSIALCQRVIAL